KFSITDVVGNKNGYVGLGQFKGKEVGPSIRKAINNAKLNIIEVKRGCGSWECGCGTTHTIPFQVSGKASSVEVTLKPAPRGVGLAVGDVAKHILRLAGFEDVWGFARGQTRTTVNYAKSVFDALEQMRTIRVREGQATAFGIKEGSVEV
ncbi:MAG: 30S ribosomal protein S5, partial [Thermoplasmata archaeon]|nr:30S ribosomal protein S5 [Thermoplasmata archaeon]NIS11861.1 30S ribosomal protein S5 [Thermoplasmata archaeon]NIS19755.1 30S ribosomal protein S5 [Thermoplasmata archaeon]NIT76940.1 30S ribosomal protein S5 [Thermoplasmata archaeon]NIU48866.1 30S ribosomal protein S5 [Thermoplasmata archaeon]